MVTISINGKKLERTFQNMAQALVFAYQNGECYAADKVEIANSTKKAGGGGQTATQPETTAEQTVSQIQNFQIC